MAVEADFGLSATVFQASGSQLSWEIAWDGVLDVNRFAAVSFQGIPGSGVNSQFVRVSEWFGADSKNRLHIGELIRNDGNDVGFCFAVVVIPNH